MLPGNKIMLCRRHVISFVKCDIFSPGLLTKRQCNDLLTWNTLQSQKFMMSSIINSFLIMSPRNCLFNDLKLNTFQIFY